MTMLQQLAGAWRVLRPRKGAPERAGKRGDPQSLAQEIRDLRRTLKDLRDRESRQAAEHAEGYARLREQIAELRTESHDRTAALSRDLAEVAAGATRQGRLHAQLRAIMQRDIELEKHVGALDRIVADPSAAASIRDRVASAPLETSPFPHLVVDQALPQALYDALILGLPPAELFNDLPVNRGKIGVPLRFAPSYCRRIWRHMSDVVVPAMLVPPIVAKIAAPLERWVGEQFPDAGIGLDELRPTPSDGRIMLRTRGYTIPPHRDPKWGFVSAILYLARPGDSETWGTQLFEVEGDAEAGTASPHWIEGQTSRQVKDVTFVPNRLLVFLNSAGAHGAVIPADQPEGLERYIYQFQIFPHPDVMARLTNSLTDERRAFWAGKSASY